jgi:hypothetical protein
MGWFSKDPGKVNNAIADASRRDVKRLDALKLKPAHPSVDKARRDAGRQRAAGRN